MLEAQLAQWQSFYNQKRTHSAIGNKTPQQHLLEKQVVIPALEVVQAAYDSHEECHIKNA